jgi:hypothetical protein
MDKKYKDKNESHITFKQINDQKVEVLYDKKRVGEVWSCSNKLEAPDNYPYHESDGIGAGYTEKDGFQICGFNDISSVWKCGIFEFKNKKDVVVTFRNNNPNQYLHEIPRKTQLEIMKSKHNTFQSLMCSSEEKRELKIPLFIPEEIYDEFKQDELLKEYLEHITTFYQEKGKSLWKKYNHITFYFVPI